MADVSVYDGSKWVSIAGEDGKDVELSPAPSSSATNVANKKGSDGVTDVPGDATIDLTLNTETSTDSTNVYDVAFGVPVGVPGPQGAPGADGTGVNILGQLQNPPGTPTDGPPTQDNTQGHDICTDGPGSAWLDKDGGLWVWSEQTGDCADDNPPTYTPVGNIQGPTGDKGDSGSISLTSDVPVTFKTDCTAGATGTFATDGDQIEPNANYKLSLTLPRGQHIYNGAAIVDGAPVNGEQNYKPNDQTGDFETACTGDIWVLP